MFIRRFLLAVITVSMILFSCSSKNPAMTIDPEEWNLVDILAGSRNTNQFWIKNYGDAPLITTFDCKSEHIQIVAEPDTVFPGDSLRLVARFTAPDETPEPIEITYKTNDPAKSDGIIPVRATVIPMTVDSETKNFTVIPFSVRIQSDKRPDNEIIQALGIRGRNRLELSFEDFRPLLEKVTKDPEYEKVEVTTIIRKWAGSLGIRYTILGEISEHGGQVNVMVILQDALFQHPITRILTNPDMDNIGEVVLNEVVDIFDNMSTERRNALMNHMQTQWMKVRTELVGNPAPPLALSDIRTGELHRLHRQRGYPVFFHFLSYDCDHCKEEMEWVTEMQKIMPEVKFYGISVDIGDDDTVLAFVNEKDVSYPILMPSENQSAQLEQYYGGATPQSVIIDKNGIVRDVAIGFNQRIIAQFTKLLSELQKED